MASKMIDVGQLHSVRAKTEQFKQTVAQYAKSDRLKTYLLGENTSIALKDLSPEEFDQFDSVVSGLGGDGWTKLGNYFTTKYGLEPEH